MAQGPSQLGQRLRGLGEGGGASLGGLGEGEGSPGGPWRGGEEHPRAAQWGSPGGSRSFPGPRARCWVLGVGAPRSWHGPAARAEIRKLTGHVAPTRLLLRWGRGRLLGFRTPTPPHPLPPGPRTSQGPPCEGLAAPETSPRPLPAGPAQPSLLAHIPGPPSTCPHRPLGSGGPTEPALLAAPLGWPRPGPGALGLQAAGRRRRFSGQDGV